MMTKRLVLLDIDGTLLWPDGAGRAAMRGALERIYGTAGEVDRFPFRGHTDRYIVHTLLRAEGLLDDVIGARFDQLGEVMVAELKERLANGEHHIRRCPGALELVLALAARDDALLGLLTGNFYQTAAVKLQAAGFDPALFRVGAYGSEAEGRDELPPLAVARAKELAGAEFAGKQIVIIGDTAHDVTCGRGVGARSIAVMTGWTDRAEIEVAQPDYLFDDLADTKTVLAAIYAPLVD
jgi:phosphoglycolate phosphatase